MNVDYNSIWFVLVGILFTGYAMLDGFDLGIGALHLFTRKDEERRIMLNTIGPVWDGNEVWLVVGGGALFAAFPDCYATVFSGFYLAFVLLLFALIFALWPSNFEANNLCTGGGKCGTSVLQPAVFYRRCSSGWRWGTSHRGFPLMPMASLPERFLACFNPIRFCLASRLSLCS